MRIAITAVFATILGLSMVLALYPVDKASTVHTTLQTEARAQDRWITGSLPDIVAPADGLDFNLSPNVADAIDITAGGYLYIDETDVGGDADVTIYCDEDADGNPDGANALVVAAAAGDGRVTTTAQVNCDFLRIDLDNYNAAGESVDIYYSIHVDRSAD